MAYAKTSLYGITGKTRGGFLSTLNYRPMPFLASDVVYTIQPQYNYRPDLLANDLYNDPNLWWVFKSRNPVSLDDPIFDFVAGVKIYIPNIDNIKNIIGSR